MIKSIEQQIIELMMDGKVRHISQLAKAVNCEAQSLNMTGLVRKGKLERVKPGTYQMPEKWRTSAALRHGKK